MRIVGIDVGIRKAAISFFDTDNLVRVLAMEVSETERREQQLHWLSSIVFDEVQEFRPDRIFIEQNLVGNNVKYSIQLAQMVGAIASELASSTLMVDFVNVSSWKKVIVGRGNARKEDVRNYLDRSHPEYSANCGDDQDKYDAICIGLYGIRLCDLADGIIASSVERARLGTDR